MIVVLILALMKEFVPIMLLRILVHAKLVSEEIAAKKVRNNLVSKCWLKSVIFFTDNPYFINFFFFQTLMNVTLTHAHMTKFVKTE